jgi:UDP-N-acetylmuramate: L-alanyl-gamma-D-glutamyl-meso-diaminopimelate ligase
MPLNFYLSKKINMKIHLIAIGGAIMHNLAIALKANGHEVSGSDDEIYEPAKSRLAIQGLLPAKEGWDTTQITPDLDCVLLGMHARSDNPELQKAQALGLDIQSFPEFVYNQSKDKIRIVIAGSHGKTTTTSLLLHALKFHQWDFDYLVGAQIEGFETMVKLSTAPIVVIEGDEYLSSALDKKPKFLHYHPHLLLITGIEWDHVNVFPTQKIYEDQFKNLLQIQDPKTTLVYYQEDELLSHLCQNAVHLADKHPYRAPDYFYQGQTPVVRIQNREFKLKIFGKHNLENAQGASLLALKLGMTQMEFWESMESFSGASKRMQILDQPHPFTIIRDFAHAPSKVRATTRAVAEAFPSKKIIAVVELHTFSSLNKDFQNEFKGTLEPATLGLVFYSPHTLAMKKLAPIDPQALQNAFGQGKVKVYDTLENVWSAVENQLEKDCVLLLMSSGNFENANLDQLSHRWGLKVSSL